MEDSGDINNLQSYSIISAQNDSCDSVKSLKKRKFYSKCQMELALSSVSDGMSLSSATWSEKNLQRW